MAAVIQMMRGSTRQGVGDESWSRYKVAVEDSDECDDSGINQDSTGRGISRRRYRDDFYRGTLAAG